VNPDGTKVVKEFYKNKRLKAEVTVKDTMRHGITKNYDEQGNLMSTVNYVDGYKDGVTVNYYKSGAKNQEMYYEKNQLQGEAKMYYEDGNVYMITNFKDGKKHGLEKTFYKNGKVQMEAEYYKGGIGIGLKEYNEKGEIINKAPSIEVKEGRRTANGHIMLEISLSDRSSAVKFYNDTLIQNKFSFPYMRQIDSKQGKGTFEYIPGRKINIIAVKTTSRRNSQVIQRSYQR
jgi:antitoxin component YwqK of YwqJK toxin-antitoxin module